MRRAPGPLAGVAVLVLGLVLGLAGCSGDEDADPDPAEPDRRGRSTSAVPGIDTRVEVGEIAGRLARRPARGAAADVARVVDTWLDAAYVGGDYPRSDFTGAFRRFTKGAARLAGEQQGLMSNAGVGERVDEVTATRRVVRVDLLAPKGRAAGATAHVNLVIELAGRVARTEQIRGRLVLTRAKGGWRVFGFDIERGEVRA